MELILQFLKIMVEQEPRKKSQEWHDSMQAFINLANTSEAMSILISKVIIGQQVDSANTLDQQQIKDLRGFIVRLTGKMESVCQPMQRFAHKLCDHPHAHKIEDSLACIKARQQFYQQQAITLKEGSSIFTVSGLKAAILDDHQTWKAVQSFCLDAQHKIK